MIDEVCDISKVLRVGYDGVQRSVFWGVDTLYSITSSIFGCQYPGCSRVVVIFYSR